MEISLISVSLDASEPHLHNTFRSSHNAFNLTVENIKKLVKYNVPVRCITTIHKGNIGDIEKIAAFVHNLGVTDHMFTICAELGRAMYHMQDLTLTPKEFLKVGRIMSDVVRRCRDSHYLVYLPPILQRASYLKVSKCAVGYDQLALRPNGEIVPCLSIDYSLGNARRDKIDEVWHSKKMINLRKELSYENLQGVCDKCIFKKYCAGMCRAHAYSVYGKLNAPYPICQKLFDHGLFPKEYLLS